MIFGMPINVTWDNPSSWPGVNASYWRLKSDQKVTPPYSFTGRMRLFEIMNPPVFDRGLAKGKTAWYNPAVVFHPLYPGNDRNIVISIGARDRPEWVGISAEMRDVRPDDPYGVRTGYVSKKRKAVPDPMDGKWHDFRCEVLSTAHYQLWWDGVLVADVVEHEPTTIDQGPMSVGLRLDFCHIELADVKVSQHINSNKGEKLEMIVNNPHRAYDSRESSKHNAGETRKIKVAAAKAAFVNIIAVDPEDKGFLTVWADGARPNSSHVNFTPGVNIANGVWVPVMGDGSINVYTHKACHVVIDVLATA